MKSIGTIVSILTMWMSLTAIVFAQDEPADSNTRGERTTSGWTGSIGLTYLTLDEEVTAPQSLDDNAVSFDILGSYYFSPRIAASVGFGFMTLDDNGEFSQQVVDSGLFGNDDARTETSEAKAVKIYGEAYYETPPIAAADLQFRAGLGYGSIASAERGIDNCVNCREEDLELDGGAYAGVAILRANWSGDFIFGLKFRQFFSSDINNSAMLWFEYVP